MDTDIRKIVLSLFTWIWQHEKKRNRRSFPPKKKKKRKESNHPTIYHSRRNYGRFWNNFTFRAILSQFSTRLDNSIIAAVTKEGQFLSRLQQRVRFTGRVQMFRRYFNKRTPDTRYYEAGLKWPSNIVDTNIHMCIYIYMYIRTRMYDVCKKDVCRC